MKYEEIAGIVIVSGTQNLYSQSGDAGWMRAFLVRISLAILMYDKGN